MNNSRTLGEHNTNTKGLRVPEPKKVYNLFKLNDEEVEALRNDAGFIKLHSKMHRLGTIDIERITRQCIMRVRRQIALKNKRNKAAARKVGA